MSTYTFDLDENTLGALVTSGNITPGPSYDISFSNLSSNVVTLAEDLTLDGVTVSPSLSYRAANAGASTWTSTTGNLTAQSAGGVTFTQIGPWQHVDPTAVTFDATGYYDSANGVGSIGTEDFVVSLVFRTGAIGSNRHIAGTYDGTTGWMVYQKSSGEIALQISDGSNTATVQSAVQVANTWLIATFFIDRSASGQCYIGGVASGSAVAVSSVGSLATASGPFRLGNSNSAPFNGIVANFYMFKRASWLSTHLAASTALDRTATIAGTYPAVYAGSGTPSAFTRDSIGYMSVYDSSAGGRVLYLIGKDIPRVVTRASGTGPGYLSEPAATNRLLRSHEYDNASWNKNASTVSADTAETLAPDRTQTADKISEQATTDFHSVYQSNAITSGTVYTASVFVKRGAGRDFAWLGIDLTAQNRVTFNLLTGAVGSTVAGSPAAGIIPFIDGWYRIWVRATANATGTGFISLGLASATSTISYAGNTANYHYFWGAQFEVGTLTPTSYISTLGSTATRAADALVLPSAGNVLATQGTMDVHYICPNTALNATAAAHYVSLDGGNSTNKMYFDINSNAPRWTQIGSSQQLQVASNISVADDTERQVRCRWGTDQGNLLVGGSDAHLPSSLTSIRVGTDHAGASQPNGIIQRITIYNVPVRGDGV